MSGVNQACIHSLTYFISGISVFRNRGYYCAPMESDFWSHRSKASYSHRSTWNNVVYAHFWSLSYFLDLSSQVLPSTSNLEPSANVASFSSRCLTGLLNGNIGAHLHFHIWITINVHPGVMKSVMGELTDSTNRAEGLSLMPVVWGLGATMGYDSAQSFGITASVVNKVLDHWSEAPCLIHMNAFQKCSQDRFGKNILTFFLVSLPQLMSLSPLRLLFSFSKRCVPYTSWMSLFDPNVIAISNADSS